EEMLAAAQASQAAPATEAAPATARRPSHPLDEADQQQHGADAPDHTAITRAAPSQAVQAALALARRDADEGEGSLEETGIMPGIRAPAPWEAEKVSHSSGGGGGETTAVFKGPVPSTAWPSIARPLHLRADAEDHHDLTDTHATSEQDVVMPSEL